MSPVCPPAEEGGRNSWFRGFSLPFVNYSAPLRIGGKRFFIAETGGR
jgi:hypothetical protein